MSFFKSRDSGSDTTDQQDRRVHSRFSVGPGLATLTLGSGRKGIIKDVSYSGMSVAFLHPVDEPDLAVASALSGRLAVLGAGAPCKLRVVRGIKHGNETHVGFSFHHATPEALLFLREIIEPMSQGATLTQIDARTLPPAVRDGGWECFSGEGPTDVIFRREASGGPAATAVVTFKINDLFHDVLYRDGSLKTHRAEQKMIDPVIPATLHRFDDGAPDPRILRLALCLMMALPRPLDEALKPMITLALATLPLIESHAA